MKKSGRISLNIAALVLAHIIIAFLAKMTAVHRAFLIIAFLFDIVYYFLLTQMLYRSRVVFSKQLFDSDTPWYKQLGIVKMLLLFAADVAIAFSTSLFSGLVIMFTPSTGESYLPNTVVWTYTIIWVSYIVFYLILAGKNAFTRKKTFLLMLGATFAATVVFSVIEGGMYDKVMSNPNSFTQYVELLDYSNASAAMNNLFKCIMACALVVFHEMAVVGKVSTAQAEAAVDAESESALPLDDIADGADIGGDIASVDDVSEDIASGDSVNEDN